MIAAPLAERLRRVAAELRHATRLRSRLLRALEVARRTRLGARPAHDLLIDLRFGGPCGGTMRSPFADRGASRVQSTSYAVLTSLFRANDIRIAADEVLVDVGCGRGRVINWWLREGISSPIVGIELVESVAEEARRRLARWGNVSIVCGDAVESIPPMGSFYYLYNPFDAAIMAAFGDALLERARRADRVRILYFNCRHREVFERDARWRVRPLRSPGPEPAVLVEPA